MPFARRVKISECTLSPLIPKRPWKTDYKAAFLLYGVFPQHLPAEKENAAKRRKKLHFSFIDNLA